MPSSIDSFSVSGGAILTTTLRGGDIATATDGWTHFFVLFFFQSVNVRHTPVFTISVNAESLRCHYPAGVADFLNYAMLSNTPACVSQLVNTLLSWQCGVLGCSPLICSSKSQTGLLGETIRRRWTLTIKRASLLESVKPQVFCQTQEVLLTVILNKIW